MNERIIELRKALKLTQTEFGNRLGVGKTTISQIEHGINNITEQMIKSICREFRINEEWLRTGNGEMFQAVTDPVAEYIAELLIDVDHPLKPVIYSIMKTYSELNEKNKALFNLILNEFIENLNNSPKN